MTDAWFYEPSKRTIFDENRLAVAREVGAADAAVILGGETCEFCEEGPFKTDGSDPEIETTFQQWQCPCCAKWNDRAVPLPEPARPSGAVLAPPELKPLLAEAADIVERFADEGDPVSTREAREVLAKLRAAQGLEEAPWVYGFRLRPVHSVHVPMGVKVLMKIDRAGFPRYGAAVLSRRLTDWEADHFDLTDLGRYT